MDENIKIVGSELEKFKFIVIGDLILDEYIFGQTERVSRESPIPVFREERFEWVCGGAANVVANLCASKLSVSVIGLIGQDEAGRKLTSLLEAQGANTSCMVSTAMRRTTRKQRVVVQGQQVFRIDTEDQFPLFENERIAIQDAISKAITPNSIILLSDYGQAMIDKSLVRFLVQAKQAGTKILVDPRGPSFDKYEGVSFIKPNLKEFEAMVDYFGYSRSENMVYNAEKICNRLALEGMIITLGEKGMLFVEPRNSFVVPAVPREVFDVTGAGDTAFAFLGIGIVAGMSMKKVLEIANVASGIAVSHLKNYVVSLDEVEEHLNTSKLDSTDSKIIFNWNVLRDILILKRSEKKKIIFTNGAFDLLHSGHISVLEQAKSFGDILVVALNTDDSIRRYKSATRPIQPLEERARIMAAIGVVDYVICFDENTANTILNFLQPDIMVKGGDYKAHELPEYETVTSYGGAISIVPFIKGFSTTNIITKMNKTLVTL